MPKLLIVSSWVYWPIRLWLLGFCRESIAAENAPENSRLQLFPRMARYNSEESLQATELYAAIADKHGLSLAQMSLAFVTDQPFVTSNIIGATTMPQLKENIASAALTLSDEILEEIDQVHKKFSNPAP